MTVPQYKPKSRRERAKGIDVLYKEESCVGWSVISNNLYRE